MSQPYLFFNKIRDGNTSALQKSKYTLWLSIQNLNLHSSNLPGVAQDVALQNSAPWPEHKVYKKKKKVCRKLYTGDHRLWSYFLLLNASLLKCKMWSRLFNCNWLCETRASMPKQMVVLSGKFPFSLLVYAAVLTIYLLKCKRCCLLTFFSRTAL